MFTNVVYFVVVIVLDVILMCDDSLHFCMICVFVKYAYIFTSVTRVSYRMLRYTRVVLYRRQQHCKAHFSCVHLNSLAPGQSRRCNCFLPPSLHKRLYACNFQNRQFTNCGELLGKCCTRLRAQANILTTISNHIVKLLSLDFILASH